MYYIIYNNIVGIELSLIKKLIKLIKIYLTNEVEKLRIRLNISC